MPFLGRTLCRGPTKSFTYLRRPKRPAAPVGYLVNFAKRLAQNYVTKAGEPTFCCGGKCQQGGQPPSGLVQVQDALAALPQLVQARQVGFGQHPQVACQAKTYLSYV